MNLLPRDVKYSIIVNLSLCDLLDLGCCSKEWNKLIQAEKFWQRKLAHDFKIQHFSELKSCYELYHELAVTKFELFTFTCNNTQIQSLCVGVKKIIPTKKHLVYIDVYDNLRVRPDFKSIRYPLSRDFLGGGILQKRVQDAIFPCFNQLDVDVVIYLSTNNELYMTCEVGKFTIRGNTKSVGGSYPHLYYITDKNELFYLKFADVRGKHGFTEYFVTSDVKTALITNTFLLYYINSKGSLMQALITNKKENLQSYIEVIEFTHRCLIEKSVCGIGYSDNFLYLQDDQNMLFRFNHNTGILQYDFSVVLITRCVKTLYPNANIVDYDGGFGFDERERYRHYLHRPRIIIDFNVRNAETMFMIGYPRIYDEK